MAKQVKSKAVISPKRGRPSSAYGKKKTRSFYLTDAAYEALQGFASELGTEGISNFLEQIARKEIGLVQYQDRLYQLKNEIPVLEQLWMLLQKPVAALLSTLAFTDHLARQMRLNLTEDHVRYVVRDAMTLLFYRGYLDPDQYIDSPTAWLRWYIFLILNSRSERLPVLGYTAKSAMVTPAKKEEEQQINKCIATIWQARKRLATQANTTHLNALKLRMFPDELSFGQIDRICKAQGATSVSNSLLNQGIFNFRRLWLNRESMTEEIDERDVDRLKSAFEYCRLLHQEKLESSGKNLFATLLISGLEFPDHDFWANEIHYFFGYLIDSESDSEKYTERQERIIENIQLDFDTHFLNEKEMLDRCLFVDTKPENISILLLKKASVILGSKSYFDKNIECLKNLLNPLLPEKSTRGRSSIKKRTPKIENCLKILEKSIF